MTLAGEKSEFMDVANFRTGDSHPMSARRCFLSRAEVGFDFTTDGAVGFDVEVQNVVRPRLFFAGEKFWCGRGEI